MADFLEGQNMKELISKRTEIREDRQLRGLTFKRADILKN